MRNFDTTLDLIRFDTWSRHLFANNDGIREGDEAHILFDSCIQFVCLLFVDSHMTGEKMDEESINEGDEEHKLFVCFNS